MKYALHAVAASAAALLLAACGGMGGGTTGPGPAPPTPAPTATPPAGVQYLVATALEPIHSAELTDIFFLDALNGSTPGGPSTTYTCNSQQTSRSYTSVPGPPQVITIDLRIYYDAACTQLENDSLQTITIQQSTSQTVTSIQRSTTEYDTAKNVKWTRTSTVKNDTEFPAGGPETATSASLTSYSVAGSTSRTNGHSLQLTQTSASAWSLNAANATLVNLSVSGRPPYAYGNSGNVTGGTVTVGGTSANPTYTYSGKHTETLYSGPVGSLAISPSALPANPPFFTAYGLSVGAGGSTYGTGSSNSSITFDQAGTLIAGNVTATSGVTNLSASADFNASTRQFQGSVKTAAGDTEASFTLDEFGNGTVQYVNGTSSVVQDFIIVSST